MIVYKHCFLSLCGGIWKFVTLRYAKNSRRLRDVFYYIALAQSHVVVFDGRIFGFPFHCNRLKLSIFLIKCFFFLPHDNKASHLLVMAAVNQIRFFLHVDYRNYKLNEWIKNKKLTLTFMCNGIDATRT